MITPEYNSHSNSTKQLTIFKELNNSQTFKYHLQSHSPQQDKVMTSAKLQIHWLSVHRHRCSCDHIFHSSRCQVHKCIPGLQGAESRVGQQWVGLDRGRQNLENDKKKAMANFCCSADLSDFYRYLG